MIMQAQGNESIIKMLFESPQTLSDCILEELRRIKTTERREAEMFLDVGENQYSQTCKEKIPKL